MYGKPTRLPAFNKPSGPDPMMDQRMKMLKKVLADRKMREQEKMVGGKMYRPSKAKGVPKLPVDKAFKGMG